MLLDLLASRNRNRIFVGISLLFVGCATTQSALRPLDGTPIKSPRERAQILIEASNGSLMEGDPIGALQYLARAEELDPKYPPIFHAKGLAYAHRKDFTAALREMKKSIDLDPENPYALNTYGKFLLDAGRLDEAAAPLQKAGDNPTFRESYKANTNLGILYYRKNDFTLADQRFQKAINDNPTNACIAYYYRGHLLVRKDDLVEATKYYERATQKQCAAFADAHLAVGMMYERSGKKDDARKKYLEIRQNFPESKASESAMERLKKIP